MASFLVLKKVTEERQGCSVFCSTDGSTGEYGRNSSLQWLLMNESALHLMAYLTTLTQTAILSAVGSVKEQSSAVGCVK